MLFAVFVEGAHGAFFGADFLFDLLVKLTGQIFVAVLEGIGNGAAEVGNADQMPLHICDQEFAARTGLAGRGHDP